MLLLLLNLILLLGNFECPTSTPTPTPRKPSREIPSPPHDTKACPTLWHSLFKTYKPSTLDGPLCRAPCPGPGVANSYLPKPAVSRPLIGHSWQGQAAGVARKNLVFP